MLELTPLSVTPLSRFYFNAGRLWPTWTVCGLRGLALILSFTTGQNLFFREMTSLKQVAIFGGEIISIPQGVINPWYVFGPLSMLALIVFVVDTSINLWRRGVASGSRSVILTSCITFFPLAAVGHGFLVNTWLVNSPYLASLSFMPTILAMSYELSYSVLRSAQLAHQLQISEAELRESKQSMELAMSAAELGLWNWDIVHNEIWSTDKGRSLFGIAKPVRGIDLIGAIHDAIEKDRIARQARVKLNGLQQRLAMLTPREREVLSHVVSGKRNKQIAAELGTAEKTVKIHRGSLMKKMKAESLADLMKATELLVAISPPLD